MLYHEVAFLIYYTVCLKYNFGVFQIFCLQGHHCIIFLLNL